MVPEEILTAIDRILDPKSSSKPTDSANPAWTGWLYPEPLGCLVIRQNETARRPLEFAVFLAINGDQSLLPQNYSTKWTIDQVAENSLAEQFSEGIGSEKGIQNATQDRSQNIDLSSAAANPTWSRSLTVVRKDSLTSSELKPDAIHSDPSILGIFVELNPLRLVADLLREHSTPPPLVIQDWADQLHTSRWPNISQAIPSNTLVTEDGVLIPYTAVIRDWCSRQGFSILTMDPIQLQLVGFDKQEVSNPWPFPWPSANGISSIQNQRKPIPQSSSTGPSFDFERSSIGKDASRKHVGPKTKRKTNTSQWGIIAATIGCVGLIGIGWHTFSRPSPSKKVSQTPNPENKKEEPKKVDRKSVDTDHSQTLDTSGLINTGSEDLTVMRTFEPSAIIAGLDDTQELTLESLLSSIQTNSLVAPVASESNNDRLRSTSEAEPESNTGNISLVGPSDIASSSTLDSPDKKMAMTAEELDTKSMQTTELMPAVAEDGSIQISQSFKPEASLKRMSFALGRSVVTKSCSCQIELKLESKNLVVEPSKSVMLNEEGKASWRIAIEDEEPELIMEVYSKPGAKWQVVSAIGLRFSASSPAILFGPNDAQKILNQLALQKQSVRNAISILEAASKLPKRKSRIDFYSEIRSRERLDREMEKSIEQWKVIAKLVSVFYDLAEVQINLSGQARDRP